MQSFACHRAASVIGLAGCLPDELTAEQIARLYMPECPDKPKQRLRAEIFRFITAAIEAGVLKARTVEIPALLERVAVRPMVDRYGRHSYSGIRERKRADTDKAPPALQNNYARRGREAIIETRPDTLSVTLISAAAFYVWDGKPPIPEGEAGELIRAWLSLATVESVAASESVPAENAARVVALPVPPRRYVSKLEQQIEHLLTAVAALGFDPMCVPRDTKRKLILPECLKRPDLFTPKAFKKAWEAACAQDRIRSELAEAAAPRNRRRMSPRRVSP